MKHQIKTIVSMGIRDHGTRTIIDSVMRERQNGEPIANPEIREMLQDFSEKSQRKGKLRIQELDEVKEKHPYSVDGISDEDRGRISIRMQVKNDSEEMQDGKKESEIEDDNQFERYKHHQYIRRWGLFSEAEGLDEEWFIAAPSVLPEDHPEYLCDMCRHIDFNLLFTRKGLVGNSKPGHTCIALYALGKVLSSSSCSFCTLLRKKIISDRLLPEEPTEFYDGETIKLNVIDDGPEYAPKLEIELESYVRGQGSIRFILQKLDTAGQEPLRGFPVKQEKADLDRLRRWLRTCEETHITPEAHENLHRFIEDMKPGTLRLIDVLENRVLETNSPARYACLSYVWGRSSHTQNTAATRQVLEARNGLLEPSINIPRTIKDSMEVTRRIGLRFLWVDALCIHQDDIDDKNLVLSQMAAIYGNSTLTIIAATNSNPSDGLAGVDIVPRSQPQIIERLQGITVAVAFHDARRHHSEIEDSVWNSRAWTFQERLLSRRAVYFTDSQMTFSCPHAAVQFEDTVSVQNAAYRPTPISDETKYTSRMNDLIIHVWTDPTQASYPNKAFVTDYGTMVWNAEDPNGPDGVSSSPAPIYECSDAPSASESIGSLQFQDQTLWETYRQAVSSYTKRKMTWHADAVSAFSGIGELIRRGTNTKFWHGIPEFAFDQALLWQPQEPVQRRMNGDMPLFPSWAWCAWEGHSSYRGRGWYNALCHPPISVVRWLEKTDKDKEIERLRAIEGVPPEEIEAAVQQVSNNMLLSHRDPYALWHLDNIYDGWEPKHNKAKNEHFYTHAVYPGVRFSYPITLPGEDIVERPLDGDRLAFMTRRAPVRFCDVAVEGHVQEIFQHDYLQIGLNDEKRSANYRPPWRRIIYHQGYRAGFLTLNVPFEEIEITAQDCYSLVAMSRDSLSSIAPPNDWQMYWQVEPRMLQEYVHREEWHSRQSDVPPPETDTEADTAPCNENGDPFWDEGRFGGVGKVDVYNVLLLTNRQGKHETRIGVGKMSYRAFHHACPKVSLVVIE